MNLQQLHYLVALGDAPSLSAAARRLGVTQPVLSRALRALERELGATLFRVEGRRLTLTDEGRAAATAARTAVRAVDRVPAAVRRSDQRSHLAVAATQRYQWMVAWLLPRLVGVPIEVVTASGDEDVVRLVLEGRAEVGLGPISTRSPDLEVIPAGTVEGVVVSPAGTGLPPVVRREDLGALALAFGSTMTDRRRAYQERLFPDGPAVPVFIAEDRAVLLEAVRAGAASTIDIRCLAERVPDVEVRPLEPEMRSELSAVRRTGAPRSEVVAFLDALREPPWY